VALLKSSANLVGAIEAAVRFYEEPPADGMTVETPWSDVWLSADDWAEAFASPEPGAPHNEAREQVWEQLVAILMDKLETDDDVSIDQLRGALARNDELLAALDKGWTLLDAADLVGDLWSVPAYLRLCAPWLREEQVRTLQRADPHAWTVSDLPLLDAARQRLGDPDAPRRSRRQRALLAAASEEMSRVVDHLVAADDSEMQVMSMLRGQDLRDALVDERALPAADPDLLTGSFAHIVVDEAQELTDAEWQMLLLRCPSRSLTIVGDRAQARHGFTESWHERLRRIGLETISVASLDVNYRTPAEVMAEAEPVIKAVFPDAKVPTSIRRSGVPVQHGSTPELGSILDAWVTAHAEGIGCVISAGEQDVGTWPWGSRICRLTPELAKGLEFDLVVLIDPDGFGTGIEGAVDRYVAMTRATQELVVLTSPAT